jgi:hypothetical protein
VQIPWKLLKANKKKLDEGLTKLLGAKPTPRKKMKTQDPRAGPHRVFAS